MEYRFRTVSGNDTKYCEAIKAAGFEVKEDQEHHEKIIEIYEIEDLINILYAIGREVIMNHDRRFFLIYDDHVE